LSHGFILVMLTSSRPARNVHMNVGVMMEFDRQRSLNGPML
jgi:hypothetical protein